MTSSFLALVKGLRLDFKTEIADPRSLPIVFDHEPFTPPVNAPWLQVSIRCGDSEPIEIGRTRAFRTTGVMFVNVFAPMNSGSALALEISDAVHTRYGGNEVADAIFDSTSPAQPVNSNGPYSQSAIVASFYFDRLKVE